ncbi:hypothetical protein Goarm_018713, partial [Gossypium armourianum]|nr:hypothetical protein [Gossypium armourianum]
IPRAANYKISGNISNEIIRVSELIDSPTRPWKVKDVEATFSEIDAGRILRILLATVEHEDILNPYHPETQVVKINFDATYDRNQFRSTSRLVARNNRGEVLALKLIFSTEVPSLFAAEAHACFQAVGIGLTMGVKEVEGDALTIIKKCQSTAIDKLEIGVFTWKDQCLGMPWNRWDLVNKENKSLIEAK